MPPTTRSQIWVFVIAAVLAVGIGTVANGFFGQEWYFNADNVVDALPLALPFLVSAGVIAGQDRWPAGRTWLTAGAWLLAAAGVLAVVLQVQIAFIENDDAGFFDAQPWFFIRAVVSAFAELLGFASLAAGLWLARPAEWRVRPAVMIGIAVVIAIAAAGPFAALGVSAIVLADPIVILGQVPISLGLFASGALAVAAIRAAPPVRPIPELLIASGAACATIAMGVSWWLFYLEPSFETFGCCRPPPAPACSCWAPGSGAATLFWPADDRSVGEAQPSA